MGSGPRSRTWIARLDADLRKDLLKGCFGDKGRPFGKVSQSTPIFGIRSSKCISTTPLSVYSSRFETVRKATIPASPTLNTHCCELHQGKS